MHIQANHISFTYPGGKRALDDVSLDLASPNLIGLLGPNGAGKTTLMKLHVAGLLPTTAEILIDGKPLKKQEKLLKDNLGYLPQIFGLYDELTIRQFLRYMATLKGLGKAMDDEVDRVMEATNLTELRGRRVGALSGGQRQRVGIAQALLGSPKFMIFDEPTAGLDPEERIKFRTLFSHSAEDKIVLLSTHIIEDIQAVCNRIIVINLGNILFDGTPEQVVQTAKGHTGSLMEHEIAGAAGDYEITSRISTSDGVVCRIVGTELPDIARPVEPTLEDAYIYLIHREGRRA